MGMKLSKEQLKKVEASASNITRVNQERLRIPLRGLPQKSLSFQIPWPPQVNNYYTVVVNAKWPHGRKMTSKEGRKYQHKVKVALHRQRVDGHVVGRLKVIAIVHPEDARRFDLDNLWKAMLDSLKKAGVFGDDSQIDDLRIVRREKKENRCIHFIVRGETPTDLFKDIR